MNVFEMMNYDFKEFVTSPAGILILLGIVFLAIGIVIFLKEGKKNAKATEEVKEEAAPAPEAPKVEEVVEEAKESEQVEETASTQETQPEVEVVEQTEKVEEVRKTAKWFDILYGTLCLLFIPAMIGGMVAMFII